MLAVKERRNKREPKRNHDDAEPNVKHSLKTGYCEQLPYTQVFVLVHEKPQLTIAPLVGVPVSR